MVFPEVVETYATIKICVKLGYKPTELFSLLQRGGDALEMTSSPKGNNRSPESQHVNKMFLILHK